MPFSPSCLFLLSCFWNPLGQSALLQECCLVLLVWFSVGNHISSEVMVQWPSHIQKTAFHSSLLHPLAFTYFLSIPFSSCCLSLRRLTLVSDYYQSLHEQWRYSANIAGNAFMFSELGVFLLKKIFIYFISLCVPASECVCMCTICVNVPQRPNKTLEILGLELLVVMSCLMCALGI